MKRNLWLVVLMLIACQSKPTAAPAPAPAPATTPTAQMRVMVSEPFRPMRGDSALAAFTPVVPAVEAGGECRLTRTGGSGATMVTASFPSFDSVRNSVTLTFDSARHLVRYSDVRGLIRMTFPPTLTDAQRDSTRRAAQDRTPTTSIGLDWAVDQALASNRGGGKPTEAVIATVREMENLEKFGPPTKRIAHVRRLCGV